MDSMKYLTRNSFPECDYFHSILLGKSSHEKGKRNRNTDDIMSNFIMNLVLPMPVVGSIQMSAELQNDSEGTLTLCEPVGKVQVTLAGSSSEGLFLPRMTHIKGHLFDTDFPDEDWKFVLTQLVVSSKRNGAFASSLDAPLSPPAFIRLKFNPMFWTRKVAAPNATETSGKDQRKHWSPCSFVCADGLINRMKLVKYLRYVLRNQIQNPEYEIRHVACMKGQPEISFSRHGPAITVEATDRSTKSLYSRDYVLCLPYPNWPTQANEWTQRQRVWPDKRTVSTVARAGCHVVPKAFKPTRDRETEFIFSFSLCDKTITKKMNLHQKRSYLLFKYIFKYFLNRVPRGLTSYLCKTTFLWFCEKKLPDSFTEYNPIECVVLLLSNFKKYLEDHNLPHYYIPEYNLISEMSPECLRVCVIDVKEVLQEPAKTVISLTEHHRFNWLSRDISIQALVTNLYQVDHFTRTALTNCVLSFLSTLLDKGEIQLVIPTLCKQWAGDYFIADTDTVIHVLEELIMANLNHIEIVNFQALLAHIYHQKGRENILQDGSDSQFIRKSLELFDAIIDNAKNHIWIYGAYYDLLYQFLEYEFIIRHFLSTFHYDHCLDEDTGIYTTFTGYNNLTSLPFNFKDLMEFTIHVPSVPYILFKVTLAYMALSRTTATKSHSQLLKKEGEKLLLYMNKWVLRKHELYPSTLDDFLFYLVSIAANEVGNDRIRDMAVKEATAMGTSKYRDLLYGDRRSEKIKGRYRSSKDVQITEPVVKAWVLGYHPYADDRRPRSQTPLQAEELRFPSRKIKVGKLLHQSVK